MRAGNNTHTCTPNDLAGAGARSPQCIYWTTATATATTTTQLKGNFCKVLHTFRMRVRYPRYWPDPFHTANCFAAHTKCMGTGRVKWEGGGGGVRRGVAVGRLYDVLTNSFFSIKSTWISWRISFCTLCALWHTHHACRCLRVCMYVYVIFLRCLCVCGTSAAFWHSDQAQLNIAAIIIIITIFIASCFVGVARVNVIVVAGEYC